MAGAKFCVTDKPDVLKYVRSKYKNSVIMIFASSEDAFSGLYKEQCATFIVNLVCITTLVNIV